MKTALFAAAAACTMAVASCSLPKKQMEMMSRMDGEWNIVEVNDSAIRPATGQAPFIGFDMKEGRIYGHTGCNRIMSTIDTKTGKMDLSRMGSTMMACPDMETERKILAALAGVKSIKEGKDGSMAMLDSKGRETVRLERRFTAMEYAALEGNWHIAKIYGEAVKDNNGNKPALNFNTKENRLGGSTGCNRLMGSITRPEGKADGIEFGQVATTRMACPDMETERSITEALPRVRRFAKLANGNVGLIDEGSAIVIELEKTAE